jgi:Na+/H+ antiporter NhaC
VVGARPLALSPTAYHAAPALATPHALRHALGAAWGVARGEPCQRALFEVSLRRRVALTSTAYPRATPLTTPASASHRPTPWRKHATVAAALGVALLILALSGGGRSAERADALATADLIAEAAADEAWAASLAERQRAWARGRQALTAAGVAAAAPAAALPVYVLDAGLPAHLRAPALAALRRLGVEPVAADRFGFATIEVSAQGFDALKPSLSLALAPATPTSLGVDPTPVIAAPARDATVRADAAPRLAGPWWSILPPLIAVAIALAYRQVLAALGAAVLMGAWASRGWDPLAGTWRCAQYLWGIVSDPFKLYVMGFTLALVGTIHLAAHTGGQAGLVELFRGLARSARSTRLVTACMGLVVFFDDYANALIVGASAKPLTDRVRVSREKLAFIVDSTAAPVAGLALISTWVGYEVGLFDALSRDLSLGRAGIDIFISILPSRFYCLTMLAFVFLNAALSRDYGPMLTAERRAAAAPPRPEAAPSPDAAHVRPRWYNAIIPIALTLLCAVVGMAWDGNSALVAGGDPPAVLTSWAGWRAVFSATDNAKVLFWSALTGAVTALGMAVGQRVLSPIAALRAWAHGMRFMVLPMSILLLAWCMQLVTKDLGTSYYLVSVLEPVLSASTLPLAAFLGAAAVAFATGTSWGTMGILLPALTPIAWALSGQDMTITLLCMGAILDGAIFGDHCSPVSDTTVMSSLACGCDHIEHVRTQMPYALTGMTCAALFGYIAQPILHLPLIASYTLTLLCLLAALFLLGKPIHLPPQDRAQA